MKDLTPRQAAILAFITAGIHAGQPPTVREIAANFGITSTVAVTQHLRALVRKGVLVKGKHRARALELPTPLVVPELVNPVLPWGGTIG